MANKNIIDSALAGDIDSIKKITILMRIGDLLEDLNKYKEFRKINSNAPSINKLYPTIVNDLKEAIKIIKEDNSGNN